MSAKLTMADLSSNNTVLSLKDHWDEGHRLLLLKGTQGETYTWAQAANDAKIWHGLGGLCGHYAFLENEDGAAQADYMWSKIRSYIGPCDWIEADAEVKGVRGSIVKAFCDRMHAHAPGLRGLEYGGSYFFRENGITRYDGWGFHAADYSGAVDFIPAGWSDWMAHQFTQTGRARGIQGYVDLSYVKRPMLQPVLRAGMVNFAVLDAKVALVKAGFGKGLAMNMTYGWGLRNAVYRYKKANGWPKSAWSGKIIGHTMWAHLNHYLVY